jgi:molecular chaperone GrpE
MKNKPNKEQKNDTTINQNKFDAIVRENTELKNTLQRLQADFDNYRKRTESNNANLIKCANKDLIMQILPIIDNFSRALAHKPKELENNNYVQGLEYIKIQIEQILQSCGLEKININRGDEFDHNIAEAIETTKSKNYKSGQITEIVLDGYKISNDVIRPSKVKVAK